LVNFKLLLVIGAAIAFVSTGGIEVSRRAVSEARQLKDEIKEKTSNFTESSKSGGKQNG